MELSALQRLFLVEFDQKTAKLGQNLCPLYRECPLYGVSVLERFHCNDNPILWTQTISNWICLLYLHLFSQFIFANFTSIHIIAYFQFHILCRQPLSFSISLKVGRFQNIFYMLVAIDYSRRYTQYCFECFMFKFEFCSVGIFIANCDRYKLGMTGLKYRLPDTMSDTGQIFISGTGLIVQSFLELSQR